MSSIPLKLDASKASALYLLIDIALSSLRAEKIALENIQNGEQKSELTLEKVKELIEHVDVLIEEGKLLAIEAGAIVDELTDDDDGPEFQPFIKSPD